MIDKNGKERTKARKVKAGKTIWTVWLTDTTGREPDRLMAAYNCQVWAGVVANAVNRRGPKAERESRTARMVVRPLRVSGCLDRTLLNRAGKAGKGVAGADGAADSTSRGRR